MKPVLYLDIDDTLLMFPQQCTRAWAEQWPSGEPAPGAGAFFLWALAHFEVRWLTMWCPGGVMYPASAARLGQLLAVPAEAIAACRGIDFRECDGWRKTNGIDWVEHRAGRPWVWVEDELLPDERELLRQRGGSAHWVPCHTSKYPHRLREVWEELADRFDLPLPPPN
jgi:hypothetical protein